MHSKNLLSIFLNEFASNLSADVQICNQQSASRIKLIALNGVQSNKMEQSIVKNCEEGEGKEVSPGLFSEGDEEL